MSPRAGARAEMARRTAALAAALVAAPYVMAQASEPERWTLELELQRFRIGNNQVQRPNDSQGTRFEVTEFTGDIGYNARLTAFVPLD